MRVRRLPRTWLWACLSAFAAMPGFAQPTGLPAESTPSASPPGERERILEPPPAVVQEGSDASGPLSAGWHAWLADRLAVESQSAAPVQRALPGDAGLSPSTQTWNRMRLGGAWVYAASHGFVRELQAVIEADVDRGSLDRFDAPGNTLTLRKGFVEATTLAGQFGAGRMVTSWGLGLVAQSGEDDPLQFGMRRGGSIVDRVQYAVLPAAPFQHGDPLKAFPLALAIAYDRVVSDDNVRLRQDWDGVVGGTDHGRNLVAALLYRGKDLQLGAYASSRHQTDVQSLGLDARIADAYGHWQVRHGTWTFAIAGEAVYASGTTTWLRTPANPELLQIEQFGGAARIEATHGQVHARLEAGVASGDSRPFDDTARNFAFASDYRVGLVLFPAYLSAVSATTRANIADPRFLGQPPAGVEHVLTHGAVTQALYVHPVVRIQATRRIAVLGGLVWARAPVDVADPYLSSLAGGSPTGPRGARSKRDLGLEVDAAAEFIQPLEDHVQVLVRADAGVLLPGDAFDDANGHAAPAMAVVQGQLALRARW
jgi:hypothetical protein